MSKVRAVIYCSKQYVACCSKEIVRELREIVYCGKLPKMEAICFLLLKAGKEQQHKGVPHDEKEQQRRHCVAHQKPAASMQSSSPKYMAQSSLA